MRKAATTMLSVILLAAGSALAAEEEALTMPEEGVLCDQYICADRNGISQDLTRKYLGEKAAEALLAQGEFDMTQFTFANGVFCDTKESACYLDRYFDADGKRSAIDAERTAQLFGDKDS